VGAAEDVCDEGSDPEGDGTGFATVFGSVRSPTSVFL
jgi:hypothetical protein